MTCSICEFVLFQATISLVIGYEPPASAIPNPNAQVDGDTSAGEAGQLFIALNSLQSLIHVAIISCVEF